MKRLGIVLSGGLSTRLRPLTTVTSKQLLPLYSKPVISYPLQTLKDMGYTEILIITANEEQETLFKRLLGDGSRIGLQLSYKVQGEPRGLADAFIVGEEFIGDADEICLILGDNVIIADNNLRSTPNTIYTFKVKDPSAYGVAKLNEYGELEEIVEKPEKYISDDAVIGLYVFSRSCIEAAKSLKPSPRGEIEIVDLIKVLKDIEGVRVQQIEGFWFDVGSFDSLLDCANLIRTIDKRTNRVIGLEAL
jgi:glucose-1-phosphate thymidylyltransferase